MGQRFGVSRCPFSSGRHQTVGLWCGYRRRGVACKAQRVQNARIPKSGQDTRLSDQHEQSPHRMWDIRVRMSMFACWTYLQTSQYFHEPLHDHLIPLSPASSLKPLLTDFMSWKERNGAQNEPRVLRSKGIDNVVMHLLEASAHHEELLGNWP